MSVLGTKDFDDYDLLSSELAREKIDVIVTGGKPGPDRLAREYAIDNEIVGQVFLPDYRNNGKSANYQRNLEIIRNSNRIIVFWNQRSRSPFNYLPYIKKLKIYFRTVIY